MLARLRNAQEKKDSGFTLIELLVVMIIIGILAAIAIPVFLSQKSKARETSAKSDVTSLSKEVAAYFVDGPAKLNVTGSSGSWTATETGTGASTPAWTTTGKLSSGNVIDSSTHVDAADNWCVAVKTSDSAIWTYSSTQGLKKLTTCTGVN
ncbi:type II secretion system protein [Motilibacter deserti]|uniref:Prepilin-type N-terminal cleavage/methylation domain-containing protein n=1 Tax=Motilibacter deserti TaxID=2714956 RepID=A0ABX0GSZ7_9ACTN|nr:prepilin-type N-terminal cleavage/methylation domain-containing protein [Motilibacter deserti]NHC14006.1 prepilin-type N-terminal cleavage/methylation domain-containing protein [Motilibacter deserti]